MQFLQMEQQRKAEAAAVARSKRERAQKRGEIVKRIALLNSQLVNQNRECDSYMV